MRTALQQLEAEGLLKGQKSDGRLRGWIVSPRLSHRDSVMLKSIVLLTHMATDPQPHLARGALEVADSGATNGRCGRACAVGRSLMRG